MIDLKISYNFVTYDRFNFNKFSVSPRDRGDPYGRGFEEENSLKWEWWTRMGDNFAGGNGE